MSLSLRNAAVSAAYSDTATVNLLSRTWASAHEIEVEKASVSLSVTVAFPYRAITTAFEFAILDHDSLKFDVVFCSEWESWCRRNNGVSSSLTSFLASNSFVSGLLVNCSLPLVDVDIGVVELKLSSTDFHVVDGHSFRSSSRRSDFASTSSFVHEREPSRVSGHAILNDMFLSRVFEHLSFIAPRTIFVSCVLCMDWTSIRRRMQEI
jgi:hypothetical protein